MYEIFYKKGILDKYNYLKNSCVYTDRIKKFELLIAENPYNNEMCMPHNEQVNYKYVKIDDEVTVQYYVDETDDSVNIYLVDIKHEWRNCT